MNLFTGYKKFPHLISKLNERLYPTYHLAIQLNYDFMRICCMNPVKKKCIWLNTYAMPWDKDSDMYLQSLSYLYQQEKILDHKQWSSVTLLITNQKYTLVPYMLFDRMHMAAYLKSTCKVDDRDRVMHCHHTFNQLSFVFSEKARVIDWFCSYYREANFYIVHQSSAILHGIALEYARFKKMLFFVWTDLHHMYVVVYDKNRLVFCNSFSYKTVGDIVGRVQTVIHTLGLPQQKCRFVLSGAIENDGKACRILKRGIPSCLFKKNIAFLSSSFDWFRPSVHSMAYFDLFSSVYCSSDGIDIEY